MKPLFKPEDFQDTAVYNNNLHVRSKAIADRANKLLEERSQSILGFGTPSGSDFSFTSAFIKRAEVAARIFNYEALPDVDSLEKIVADLSKMQYVDEISSLQKRAQKLQER